MIRQVYEFNPACECQVCRNGGRLPSVSASRGHSFCYEEPHIPPRPKAAGR